MPYKQQAYLYVQKSLWLLVFMLFVMVVIGGVTRLTGSGLSIVEWKPVIGIFPPLSQADWLAEFRQYQTSPEFMKVNFDMTLVEFKSIFWLEYIHRLWGRLLGLVLLFPTVMALRHKDLSHLLPKIGLLWVLGLSQGVMGWYMVESGLVQDPHVSPYRLAAHLVLGFGIFAVALMAALSMTREQSFTGYSYKDLSRVQGTSMCILIFVSLTVIMGAFVAGLKGGLVYNTFPTMEGQWIPHEFDFYPPLWRNLTENPVTAQYIHRILATLTCILTLGFVVSTLRKKVPESLLGASLVLAAAVLVQYGLGIATLLFQVPVTLGAAHQACALVVFGILVYMLVRADHRRLN